ncbi:MAG: transcriptional regulator, family [Rhizobacter sp.]|nr:transcriptional regulator, family [Rhizobacter sp.]
MPAKAPIPANATLDKLGHIGQRIRAQRKALRVSATTAAEAAGMSRVTLHRIELGEPSVTMGAYVNAMVALGLDMEVVTASAQPPQAAGQARSAAPEPGDALPARISLADYPQLKRLAWSTPGKTDVTPAEALSLYERNWRHVDREQMDAREAELVNALAKTIGKGRLLV